MKPSQDTRVRLSSIAGGVLKLSAVLFGAGVLSYVILVAWLHHHLSSQAISITQAAGVPVEAERVIKGFLSWLAAFALVPALIRLATESLNPFRSAGGVMGRLGLLLIVAFCAALLPHGFRILRGVDHAGLPVRMELSDPTRAIWWNPDGDPVLFHSNEIDGGIRFWNRPGITPDTGLPSLPITRDVRARWQEMLRKSSAENDRVQRHIAESRAQVTELSTLTDSLRKDSVRLEAEAELLRREREASDRRAAEALEKLELQAVAIQTQKPLPAPAIESSSRQVSPRQPTQPRPAPSAWITRTLYPSGFLTARGAPNSRIEIRSDGRGLFHAPGSQPLPFAGGTSSFHTSAPEFRLVGRESGPFLVTYRWIPQ